MPKPGRRGRPREVDFRQVINAVRYLVRSGCGWRMLPIHFGPWQTAMGGFGSWRGGFCTRPSTTWL
ncbi:transposase [Mesorhizobium sp.]|uniref:transposase n=1 Tax=Mesorhizobium sp. TaxID=1871066 RepID=UPI00257B70D6|nr:transposase [Mesorhizobium sp.]